MCSKPHWTLFAISIPQILTVIFRMTFCDFLELEPQKEIPLEVLQADIEQRKQAKDSQKS